MHTYTHTYMHIYYTILNYTILCHFNAVSVPEEVSERMVILSNTVLELNV